MSTQQYSRPDTSAPNDGESGLPNRDKFQDISATVPKIPISSEDVDSEINNLIDAVNELFDTAISGTVPDNSVTLAKLAHLAAGSMYIMDGTGIPTELTAGSDGEFLSLSSGLPVWVGAPASPTASVTAFAGSSAPTGWLICDGSAVSRATYATLFSTVSTTYGVGDGSTTFNLPDLRGRNATGLDNMGVGSADRITDAQADVLGGVAGSEDHVLDVTELPSHTHGFSTTTSTDGDHTHTTGVYTGGSGSSPTLSGGSGHIQQSTGTDGDHSHTVSGTTDTGTGGGAAHNNLQPSLFMNYIIKT